MAEHTPWEVFDKGGTLDVHVKDTGAVVVHWLGFDDTGFDHEQNRKHASLIASAPTLKSENDRLKARVAELIEVSAALAVRCNQSGLLHTIDFGDKIRAVDSAIKSARAALQQGENHG